MSGNDTLDVPFDQYQRYKTASIIINDYRSTGQKFSILEIGANEHRNLEIFLPEDDIKYLDIKLSEKLQKNKKFILADATNMPEIATDSFDLIVALDVFEHIPKLLRENFLKELNRVSKHMIVLSAPFDNKNVQDCEFRVNEYFKIKFGKDYIWLEEHMLNGLPNLNETIEIFNNLKDRKLTYFKHGSLFLWEKLIRVHFEVADNSLLQNYRQNLDYYYNKNMFLSDIDENCYRDFLIYSNKVFDYKRYFDKSLKSKEIIDTLSDLMDSIYRLSFEKKFLNINAKNEQIQIKEEQIQEKERQIQKKEQQIQEKNKELEDKEQYIQNQNMTILHWENVAQSMRIKNRIKRLIKKIIPTKVWKILKYIRHNPSALRLGLHTLKTQGLGSLLKKMKKVDYLPAYRINNSYNYLKLVLSDDIKKEIEQFSYKPLVSIIMPVYNVDPKWLDLAIKSIENQWYENWELCIADDKSTNQDTIDFLKAIDNPKIKIKILEKNQNISIASNEALKLASGEYIGLMDHDDEITTNALYEVVKIINKTEAEFIYSDEDKVEMNGTFSDPHFKPDFASDMFLSQNYISHFGVIKKELIEKVDGWEQGLEGAQDYDLYLKVLEHTDKIYHVSKVLYHWRKIPGSTAVDFDDKSYAQEAGRKSLENAMQRRNIDAKILNGKYPGTYKVEYLIKNNPLVSIVIPFKDKAELLKMCIESILNKSTYKNFEIIGISNNSKEQSIFKEMKRLKALDDRIRFYEYNVPFNYSNINNHAVKEYANGEQIILLNNDIEIITHSWIEELLMHSQRDEVGVVGAKLYYPNETIQHAGISMGVLTLAGHNFRHHPRNVPAYMGRESVIQNVSAVTAACLMVKKVIFEEVGGLNEKELKIAFNDVDFCLNIQEKGYLNIFTPYCEAYHHESVSRGLEDTTEKVERFKGEVAYMQKMHEDILKNGDPYYNSNLTLEREDFSLR